MLTKIKENLEKFSEDPGFYVGRELAFASSLLSEILGKPACVLGSGGARDTLQAALTSLSLRVGETHTPTLLPFRNLAALLRVVRALSLENVEIWLSPSSRPPLNVAKHSLVQLYRLLRGCSNFSIWVRQGIESDCFWVSLLDEPPGFYRDRNPDAFMKNIGLEAWKTLGPEYDRLVEESDFFSRPPIDVVFTWVNGADEQWRNLLRRHRPESAIDWDRFVESDELRYALRSVFFNAPWVRKVFVVSNCRPPAWLSVGGRVCWVDHSEIIPETYLPTFNSHVIEAFLWRVPGLMEHFVYFNDDMFLGQRCVPGAFFLSNGASVSYMESFGSVDAYIEGDTPELMPWQHAARRGADLIFQRFGQRPTQHHRHVPYAMKRSVAFRMVDEFRSDFERLYGNRFRDVTDVSPTSFLYHHYAYHVREAVRSSCSSWLLQTRNYRQLRNAVLRGPSRQFFCLNDGAGSHSDDDFQDFKRAVMRRLFPVAASWERG